MSAMAIIVTGGGLVLIAILAWYFFGPKKAQAAEIKGEIQEIAITVKGGYSPDIIKVRQGVPLRLVIDRQEAGECSSRIVFPDFQASKTLPAFGTTTLEFTPDKIGSSGFACGMNMLHGTLVVEGADDSSATQSETSAQPAQPHEFALAVGVGPKLLVEPASEVEFALIGGGVNCPTCVVNIEAFLDEVPGIDEAQVNFGAERVTVRYDAGQVSVKQIQTVIKDAGYDVLHRENPGTQQTEYEEA